MSRVHGPPLTNMLHTMPEHHFVENLSALHADEAVVHFGLTEWLQRLRLGLNVAVERWTGHRSLRLGRRRHLRGSRCGI